jgi:hypothetical protein
VSRSGLGQPVGLQTSYNSKEKAAMSSLFINGEFLAYSCPITLSRASLGRHCLATTTRKIGVRVLVDFLLGR